MSKSESRLVHATLLFFLTTGAACAANVDNPADDPRNPLSGDDGSGGSTLHDLADEFGVSAERIRQIEASAMKKMRSALNEYA